jgi:glucose-6-phosphate 1-dehydrogenase
VTGQYGAGRVADTDVPGYREEPGVARASVTPTFAALRLEIENWRWHGVPFFLRSGKRMAVRRTEIAVCFRDPPHRLFHVHEGDVVDPNVLTFRIQPEEEIALSFGVKVPGPDVRVAPVRMVFSYADAFHDDRHPAYETLLLDAMQGDATLFDRADSVEEAWRIMDPIVEAAEHAPADGYPNYPAGSWGPAAAEKLIAQAGADWRNG